MGKTFEDLWRSCYRGRVDIDDAYERAREQKVRRLADAIKPLLRPGLNPAVIANGCMQASEGLGLISGDTVSIVVSEFYTIDEEPATFDI